MKLSQNYGSEGYSYQYVMLFYQELAKAEYCNVEHQVSSNRTKGFTIFIALFIKIGKEKIVFTRIAYCFLSDNLV